MQALVYFASLISFLCSIMTQLTYYLERERGREGERERERERERENFLP